MFKIFAKLPRFAIVISMVGLTALAAWASTAVNVTASLTETCPNCQTDTGGYTLANYTDPGSRPYSLVGDGYGPYSPTDNRIQSQILTNNSVYTLDTSATLVNGYVVTGITRTVDMHFFSPVECGLNGRCPYTNNILPPCWGLKPDAYDQNQAVNWSVFAPTSFVRMKADKSYQGMARVNFNVRTADCERQISRFRLEWGAVCITHPTTISWTVTSDVCGAQTKYGEAHLQAYGGTAGNTVDYGDWRMPFVLTLTK